MEIIEELESRLYEAKDATKIKQMEAYMRNQFSYIGVGTTLRRQVTKDLIAEILNDSVINWPFIFACFAHDKRELQNIAVDYLKSAANKNKLLITDIDNLYQIIHLKSWWDTIDELSHVLGKLTKMYPIMKEVMITWSKDPNFWVRRVAIIHQLMFKNTTDTKLLEIIINNNLGSKEFFINKAIGWILRDYSYTNPDYVKDYIDKNKDVLNKLSIKEGLKRIK